MPDKVVLLRGDGTRLEATEEQANRLALLGYQRETPEQRAASFASTAAEDYYTSAGQKALTGLEGAGAGATFGATDYLFGDDETKKRAFYNPGTRLATEILGAVGPALVSGGESAAVSGARAVEEAGVLAKAAKFAPTNLLADAAKALAPGTKGLTHAVVAGAIEGGIYGGAGAADHAYLDGDPITAEAVLHGVGWGAFVGGGISAVGHGIEAAGKSAAESIAKEPGRIPEYKNLGKDTENTIRARDLAEGGYYEPPGGHTDYTRNMKARQAISEGQREPVDLTVSPSGKILVTGGRHRIAAAVEQDMPLNVRWTRGAEPTESDVLRNASNMSGRVPNGALGRVGGPKYNALRDEVGALAGALKEASGAADAAVTSTVESLTRSASNAVERDQISELTTIYERLTKATTEGKSELADAALKDFTTHANMLGQKFGTTTDVGALKDLVAVRAAQKELASFPSSVQGFAAMSPAKFERMAAAMERVPGLPFPNAQAVGDAAKGFSASLGVEAQDLRSTWRVAKDMYKNEGKPMKLGPGKEAPSEASKEPSMMRRMAGYALGGKAYAVAHAAGMGPAGAYIAYRGIKNAVTYGGRDLATIRGTVISRLKQAAADYLPPVGKAAKSVAAPAALATTLFGEHDTAIGDVKELALRRIKEINEFGPTAKDTIFRAAEPLAISQPKLAPAMHASALQAFQALQNMVPKDPGVISKLQTIWRPSDVHAMILAKQLQVFHDPVGTAEFMLRTGRFDPIQVESLREIAPNTWQDLRVSLLERITDPKVRDKLSYQDQIGLSAMLDLPIHSSMAPEYIATSQQLFLDRSQPLTANPRIGQGGGAPNPADNTTAAQKSEMR